eukprot:IDg17988t1
MSEGNQEGKIDKNQRDEEQKKGKENLESKQDSNQSKKSEFKANDNFNDLRNREKENKPDLKPECQKEISAIDKLNENLFSKPLNKTESILNLKRDIKADKNSHRTPDKAPSSTPRKIQENRSPSKEIGKLNINTEKKEDGEAKHEQNSVTESNVDNEPNEKSENRKSSKPGSSEGNKPNSRSPKKKVSKSIRNRNDNPEKKPEVMADQNTNEKVDEKEDNNSEGPTDANKEAELDTVARMNAAMCMK